MYGGIIRLCVAPGASKCEAAALAPDGAVLAGRRLATPRGDYPATIGAIADLVQQVEVETGRSGSVGVGIPGALSTTTGTIKNANSTWLLGRPLDRDLTAALGRPVRLMNDANCLALSEAADGAAAGLEVVFGVILGTGVGGGIAIAGRPLVGCNAISGEWGHNPRSEEHTSELQSLMRISYAVSCLTTKKIQHNHKDTLGQKTV